MSDLRAPSPLAARFALYEAAGHTPECARRLVYGDEHCACRDLPTPRVIVCGGRDYTDGAGVHRSLSRLRRRLYLTGYGDLVIAHGGARGADTLAGRWAADVGVECVVYPADWERDGKRAGPVRNARMLAEFGPTHVVAFAGGRGTADMVRRARGAELPVWEVKR